MKKFYAIYRAPTAVLDEWMKLPQAERDTQMKKMEGQWAEWLAAHKGAVKESAGLGKNKQVTGSGVADARNDLMMYSIVEAEDAAAAAKIFEGHPHFQIPQATIDIMEANYMPGM